MSFVFPVFWILIFHWFGEADSYGSSVTKSTETCMDDWCPNKSNDAAEKNLTSETPNSYLESFNSTNLNETAVYFLTASESHPEGKNHPILQTENKNDKLLLERMEEINSTHTTEDNNNATDVTDISEITTTEVFSSTTQLPKPVSSTTIKPNSETAEINPILQNVKKRRKICFCDMEVNKCDINCCCDEDCSLTHFKVFSQCDDNNNMYDSKYCYNTNFIVGNNTSHEVIQNSEGLFCIVRENLKVGINYKTRAPFKTLDAFNKTLQNKLYTFSYKTTEKLDFVDEAYLAGSPVWTLQNGELMPFKISYSSVGFLCNSEVYIKYLVDEVKSCFYKEAQKPVCGSSEIAKVLRQLKGIKIISNPVSVNKSELQNSSKGCQDNFCIGITLYICQSINNSVDCIKILEQKSKNLTDDITCWNSLSHIQYQIWHNGSEGIKKIDAYLWVKKNPQISNEFLSQLITEVKYGWVSTTKKVFKRSGNPGYITGKPILAGKKIQNAVNEPIGKKEAIELSLDPKDWLSVLGSNKGICSSKDKIPINFRENGQYMCSLKLSERNFSKEKCIELQNTIFKLLVGDNVLNETKENYFNKFVATFGNSRVEETGDWVQVLIDSFPVISSQAYFKSNHYFLTCKNMITDLLIDIIYSNTGSFLAPQAKILGVSFQFGKHKDLIYYCDTPGCENTTVQYFKLSTSVNFFDVTKPAVDAFAEPLSLEVKLPHDFFYPFFSDASKSKCSDLLILILFFLLFL